MSTGAGPPAAADGRPRAQAATRRGLRDRPLGRIFLLGLVLLAALLVARTCAAVGKDVSKDEAIAIATKRASFEPCSDQACVQIRYVQRGIPPRPFWAVVVGEKLGANRRPTHVEGFLIDVRTGAVSRP